MGCILVWRLFNYGLYFCLEMRTIKKRISDHRKLLNSEYDINLILLPFFSFIIEHFRFTKCCKMGDSRILTRKNNRIVVYEMYQDGQGPNQGRDFCENLLLVVFIDLAASN